MRLLLEKIRKILRDRRARQMLTRTVSSLAAVVVFVTTYALILPAITMESQAVCGIPAHQHDDSCYEEVLVCGLPESDGHTHTDACYTVVSELVCGLREHQHVDGCYDADGNLICGMTDHLHEDSCYQENRTLTCGLEETEGYQHDASCYEKQLVCGMEAHTHSAACYSHASGNGTDGSSAKDYAVVAATTEAADGAASGAGNTGTNTDITTDAAAGTDLSALPAAEDAYVPELEALFFDQLLTKKTGIYYFHPEEGKTIPENSADITDWTRVKDDTELAPADMLRVYLRYTIPAGSLNSTNPVARYRLPANLHLTDQQMEEINTNVNGIANQYVNLDTLEILDPDQYNQYLGIEAVEGTRTPADDINEYFAKHPDMNGQEFISAVVRAENVYDTEGLYGEKDAYLGQDLIFTFTPYTIQKNQNEYDSDGQPTKAGEKVQGWFCLDLHMDQVDWDEPAVTTEEKDGAKTSNTDASDANVDETTESAPVHKTLIEQKESNADILFVAEDKSLKIDEISTNLRMIEQTEINPEGNDDADKDQDEENAATAENGDESDLAAASVDADTEKPKQASPNKKTGGDGAEGTNDAAASTDPTIEINAENYPAVSFEDSIVVHAGTLSTDNKSAAKGTPEETTIAVSVTADAETFPRGTTMVLGAVDDMDTVASAVEGAVEGQTRGFHAVDISFLDSDGHEIEPLKPIKVSMTSEAIKQAVEDSSTVPVVVHVENPAVSSATDKSAPADPANADSAAASSASEDSVETDAVSQKADPTADKDDPASAPTATIVESNETNSTDNSANRKETADTLSFDAGSFSVYAIVYTVDFHYEVNGKMYEFSIPGGGFASFYKIVEVLGIARIGENTADSDVYNGVEETGVDDNGANGSISDESINLNNVEVSEATKNFVADVASVEFSSPELVWVGKVEETATVGGLKEANGLNVEYSTSLTKEQIEAINRTEIKSGDWVLISMQPFTSEAKLTVTMKNGEVFTVKVTDAQISTLFLSASGKLYEVTVTYDEAANIPEGSTLQVTEFSEDDAEYEYARNSVLADKKARGELVDLNSFGLAALDISILNPDGKEIEPEAAVQVEIRIKELPGVEELSEVADTLAIQHHVEVEDGVVVETVFNGNTEASFRLETNETVAAEGIAVDPASVSEEDFADVSLANADSLAVEFETEAFSTFTISWNNAYGNGTKIHYVDESGHELTVKNTTVPRTIGSNSTSPAYLIYDIEGYEYSYTYYNNTNTKIYPYLVRERFGWAYYNSDGREQYLDLNRDIYVVYKKKADIAQGGTPTVKQSGDVKPPVAPRINKESTPNGDDTNTLALSLISDTAKLEVEKLADVIVVFDVSGSMSTADMGGNKTRLKAAQEAVNSLAEHLATKKNSAGEPLVRMSLIQFSTKASTVLGMTDLTTTGGSNSGVSKIKKAVNELTADGGTNWDHALQLANEENDLDSGRATFVIFVTDGDPTFRNARMDVTNQALQGETNNAGGAYNPYYLISNVYGPGDNDKTGKCYDAAVLQGDAIVHAGKNIYTIGISNDVKKVQTFNSAIHGNGAYVAANSSALQQAFSDIEASISGAAGWGNIQMTDGITNLTNTVQKTGLTNVGGDFTYWIAPAPANWSSMTEAQKNAYKPAASAFIPWDPKAAGAALAEYNTETGAVEWNMGSTFMPEAGVTYQVRFKVWPSQEAYDYIAKLNNGTIKYDVLPAAVQAQIIKSGNTYTLKTNEADAKTTYQTATKTGNTVTVSGETQTLMFPTVEDLKLHVDKMKVKKEWQNSLDPDSRWKSRVELLLTDGAGNLYKSIDLKEENNYSAEDNFISCGLAKIENGELIIYEQGHDFKLTEPEEYAYYWDLDSDVYRPMVIDAVLTMLVKADAPSGMGNSTCYEDQGVKYYKIGGSTYKAISTGDAAAEITATNVRRSNLNLTKRVVDEEGKPAISSEAFTFTITINDAKGADVWFSVLKDASDTSTIVKNLSTSATAEVKNGENTGYYHTHSGNPITVSIEPGWNLRFTNLPNGTTYTITENAKENYDFVNAVIDNNGTFSVQSGTTTGTGTISESDKQYTVTYTNQAVTQQVYIQKTAQDARTPLQGAEFILYTKDGYDADPQNALKTELVSDEDGKIDLGRLVVGEYYLEETKAPAGYILLTEPVEIKVTASGVQYKQITNSLSSSNEGVSGDRESGYTLVVTNNAGYELPSTGGSGTCFLYLLGLMLTTLACMGMVMKSSRRKNAA